MDETLKRKIESLAGSQRAATFVAAAEWVLTIKEPFIIETGCYRGNAADGQSTAILALLAKETDGEFFSFELHEHNIVLARQLLKKLGLLAKVNFVQGDSAITLKQLVGSISFAYLDSYDFEEHKAIDAQAHNLVEVGLLLPKMARASAFLFDDCALPLNGKCRFSAEIMSLVYYRETASGYQRLFTRQL